MVRKNKLFNIISKFRFQKVLVLGDIILDHYVWGLAQRLSPEAPVPVVWLNKETYLLGGAANVANNIKSLGAEVLLCGITGKDLYAHIVFDLLKKEGINFKGVFKINTRPTTLKTRVIASHQQVVRIDREDISEFDGGLKKRIINFVKRNIKYVDALIIEDYGKGVINKDIVVEVVNLCKNDKKIVTVDPKEDHFQFYKNIDAITPNKKEASIGTGINIKTSQDLDKAGIKLCQDLGIKTVLITLGEEGMVLYEKGRKISSIPTVAREVFDVTGAGDTVISCFTLGLCAGATSIEAATLANYAAGIVVGRLGASAVSTKELKEVIKNA